MGNECVKNVPDKELIDIVKGYLLLRNAPTPDKVDEIKVTRDKNGDTWTVTIK